MFSNESLRERWIQLYKSNSSVNVSTLLSIDQGIDPGDFKAQLTWGILAAFSLLDIETNPEVLDKLPEESDDPNILIRQKLIDLYLVGRDLSPTKTDSETLAIAAVFMLNLVPHAMMSKWLPATTMDLGLVAREYFMLLSARKDGFENEANVQIGIINSYGVNLSNPLRYAMIKQELSDQKLDEVDVLLRYMGLVHRAMAHKAAARTKNAREDLEAAAAIFPNAILHHVVQNAWDQGRNRP